MSENKRPFKKFNKTSRKSKSQTTEEKIKNFVLKNSKNGYYTKVSTLSYKFEVSEQRVWEIVGDLLSDGEIESIHDQKSGEMKLCQEGKIYHIMNLEQSRKKEKSKEFKNRKSKMTSKHNS